MADIRPFRAIRPRQELADKIAALPYDVYNRQEAKAAVENRPHSFLRIDRAETQFPDTTDTYADCVYERAKELLWKQIEEGDFIQEEASCYYLYEQTMNGRVQTGIVACASIDDYNGNVIKKHENTRADKEADRIRHVDICNAQTGPIFLAYRSNDEIREIVERTKEATAIYDFVSEDEIRHRIYIVNDRQDVDTIRGSFSRIPGVYIADGHHRCASAVKVGLKRRQDNPQYTGEEEYNFFLSVLFPDEDLMIMDYNRVVKDLNGYTEEEFIGKLEKEFAVEAMGEHAGKPSQKGEIAMYLKSGWYMLTANKSILSSDPVSGLDVSLLQEHVLDPLLGIADPKTDKRVDFVGGIRGLNELERRVQEDMAVAFAMYPTSIGELFDVADAGLLMPPKSTWFEPKLRSGLFVHSLS